MDVGALLAPLSSAGGVKLLAALKAGEQVDWRGMIAAFESGDRTDAVITLVEGGMKIGGVFFPPLAVAESDLEALIFLVRLLHSLGARPADVSAPPMRHADGQDGAPGTTNVSL